MIVGVVKETFPGERRVALVPDIVPPLKKKGFEVVIESGAGARAGFSDSAYEAKGAQILGSRQEVFQRSDILAQVRCYGANPEHGKADLALMRPGQIRADEDLAGPRRGEIRLAVFGVGPVAPDLRGCRSAGRVSCREPRI